MCKGPRGAQGLLGTTRGPAGVERGGGQPQNVGVILRQGWGGEHRGSVTEGVASLVRSCNSTLSLESPLATSTKGVA